MIPRLTPPNKNYDVIFQGNMVRKMDLDEGAMGANKPTDLRGVKPATKWNKPNLNEKFFP